MSNCVVAAIKQQNSRCRNLMDMTSIPGHEPEEPLAEVDVLGAKLFGPWH
jgi:hypothetical protein